MSESNKVSRRFVLSAGAGIAAGVVSGTVVGGVAPLTPENPEGPFYPKRSQLDKDTDLTQVQGREERAQGQVIRVTGRVLDDNGEPVEGALVDIWQANAFGRYDHEDDPATAPLDPNFQGWGMVKTDAEGRYSFTTIKPGRTRMEPAPAHSLQDIAPRLPRTDNPDVFRKRSAQWDGSTAAGSR